jgi:mono/diheme cytochrome c family protein
MLRPAMISRFGAGRRRERPVKRARILLPSPRMKRTAGFCASIALAALAIMPLLAQTRPRPADASQSTPSLAPDPRLVERGDYLTHHVAMCVECHSPRDRRGVIIPGQEFRGAPNPFTAPFPGVPWAIRSVNIRGLGGLPEDAVVRLLTTGVGRNGAPPDPPMPQFRMLRADAEAIVAYLRSLE